MPAGGVAPLARTIKYCSARRALPPIISGRNAARD